MRIYEKFIDNQSLNWKTKNKVGKGRIYLIWLKMY
jgi:hypothetical protein